MKEHLYIILALLLASYANTNCTFTACTNGGLQTPAQKQACGITISVGLTMREKCDILKQHNALRSYVAAGLEKRGNPGPQPAALNMKIMRWDTHLACMAQTWANNCKFAHDPCRKDGRFYVGQNIGSWMTNGTLVTTWADIIKLWYDKVAKVNRSQMRCYSNSIDWADYTQLVWATSDKLGCGKIVYQSADGFKHYYIVCNYGPGGNIGTMSVYEPET